MSGKATNKANENLTERKNTNKTAKESREGKTVTADLSRKCPGDAQARDYQSSRREQPFITLSGSLLDRDEHRYVSWKAGNKSSQPIRDDADEGAK